MSERKRVQWIVWHPEKTIAFRGDDEIKAKRHFREHYGEEGARWAAIAKEGWRCTRLEDTTDA